MLTDRRDESKVKDVTRENSYIHGRYLYVNSYEIRRIYLFTSVPISRTFQGDMAGVSAR